MKDISKLNPIIENILVFVKVSEEKALVIFYKKVLDIMLKIEK